MTQELICGIISGLDSMGMWQGWFLDARRCSAEKGGLQGSMMGVEVTVLVQVRNLAHDQPELVTPAQERAVRLRTDLVQGVCCFLQACYLRFVC